MIPDWNDYKKEMKNMQSYKDYELINNKFKKPKPLAWRAERALYKQEYRRYIKGLQ